MSTVSVLEVFSVYLTVSSTFVVPEFESMAVGLQDDTSLSCSSLFVLRTSSSSLCRLCSAVEKFRLETIFIS